MTVMFYRRLLIPLLIFILVPGLLPYVQQTAVADSHNAPKPVYGKIIKYGQFELVRGGDIVKNKSTSTGKALSNPVLKQVNSKNKVAAKRDNYLAYQFRIGNLKNDGWVNLRRVLVHPEMTLPDGSVSSGSDYLIKRPVNAGQVIAYDGYGLNEDYELVEGEWIFQIWYESKKLIEQKFTTYRGSSSIK